MPTPEQIDAILPQTQCGLCGFNGCMPYANALAKKEAAINLCPPGGTKGLLALAHLLNEDPTPFLAEMEQKAKPAMVALIREAECIGCTKCIQACPVDAIIGAGKLMHTVMTDECTGCELCVAPCPVDCIDILPLPASIESDEHKRTHFRNRFRARTERLQRKQQERETNRVVQERKAYIQAALLRAKAKKSQAEPR